MQVLRNVHSDIASRYCYVNTHLSIVTESANITYNAITAAHPKHIRSTHTTDLVLLHPVLSFGN